MQVLCAGNIWEEPWEQQSALATIRKIERHWHQLASSPIEAAPRSSDAAEGPIDEGSDGEEAAGHRRQQAVKGVNQVCNHVACSAQAVCLVEQLQTVRDNYRGRSQQFQIKVRCCLFGDSVTDRS